ncbi:hypothetical protein GTB64_004476 [Salmonella enterica]|nr:hypothetical protein [Salmonella enterica]
MNYAVNYTKDGETYHATFPDFPDIQVTASSVAELESSAYDALAGHLMSFMESGLVVPHPLALPAPGYISLIPSATPKILLHNLLVAQNKSRAWLSRQMGVTRQMMTRMFNLREVTKVETLQQALDALGYDMYITIQPKPRNYEHI